jgi:hypothetical protein
MYVRSCRDGCGIRVTSASLHRSPKASSRSLQCSRTPDIIVIPNVGVVYTGSLKKQSEHGGFAHDDTNVMLLVSNPSIEAHTDTSFVETDQVAPTILRLLGLDPDAHAWIGA